MGVVRDSIGDRINRRWNIRPGIRWRQASRAGLGAAARPCDSRVPPNGTDRLPRTASHAVSGLDRSRLEKHVALAPYTTFRIGGPADLFYTATSADDLAAAILAARDAALPYFVLGLGANILIGDGGFRGLVIRNTAAARGWSEGGILRAESGAIMQDLVLESGQLGWSGLEHYIGIPSTVGGAIWQNLHFLSPAPERERTMFIAEVFDSCEILSAEGERKTVGADYVQFGYD